MQKKKTWKQLCSSRYRRSTPGTEMERKEIVNISRAFLDTNGAHQETDVEVEIPKRETRYLTKTEVKDVQFKWLNTLSRP